MSIASTTSFGIQEMVQTLVPTPWEVPSTPINHRIQIQSSEEPRPVASPPLGRGFLFRVSIPVDVAGFALTEQGHVPCGVNFLFFCNILALMVGAIKSDLFHRSGDSPTAFAPGFVVRVFVRG